MDSISQEIYELVDKANPINPLSYIQQIVQPLCIDNLNNIIKDCKDCPNCNTIKSITYGNPNATIMLVGDYISKEAASNTNENFTVPFKDSGGELLNQALQALKINEEELFRINVVNCWPYKKVGDSYIKRAPTKEEITNCRVFIDYAIEVVKPSFIIVFGNVALNRFKKKFIINNKIEDAILNNVRGEMFDIRGIDTIATYHPYDLIDNIEEDEELLNIKRNLFFEDLSKAFEYVKDKFPNTNLFKNN